MDTPEETSVVFTMGGAIAQTDIRRLCNELRELLDDRVTEVVICDVELVRNDAVTVDALAHLHLTARRLGCRLRLSNASPELRELIAFMGLRRTLPVRRS